MGEVFTPHKYVCMLLDQLPEETWLPEKTCCDPACGNGNFLVEAVKRKITKGATPTQALSTVYGVDIDSLNVFECRTRLLRAAADASGTEIQDAWIDIVCANIVLGDSLEYNFEFKRLFPEVVNRIEMLEKAMSTPVWQEVQRLE